MSTINTRKASKILSSHAYTVKDTLVSNSTFRASKPQLAVLCLTGEGVGT